MLVRRTFTCRVWNTLGCLQDSSDTWMYVRMYSQFGEKFAVPEKEILFHPSHPAFLTSSPPCPASFPSSYCPLKHPALPTPSLSFYFPFQFPTLPYSTSLILLSSPGPGPALLHPSHPTLLSSSQSCPTPPLSSYFPLQLPTQPYSTPLIPLSSPAPSPALLPPSHPTFLSSSQPCPTPPLLS